MRCKSSPISFFCCAGRDVFSFVPDIFTVAKRSEVMSLIKSRGNKDTELRMMAVFREHGIKGWRRHVVIKGQGVLKKGKGIREKRKGESTEGRKGGAGPVVKVRPDFVFPKLKVAVFVDGCFWHACPKCYIRPRQNRKFWDAKREMNQARDRRQSRALRKAGWTVMRLWEHDLAKKREGRLVGKLKRVVGGTVSGER